MKAEAETSSSENLKRGRALLVVSLATLFGLSVWFSTNAVAPALESEKGLSPGDLAWLTIAVQLGFVAGTLLISALNLADLLNARRLFAASALAAGVLNLAVIPLDGFAELLPLRFATGMFLGGVYPPGMKILSGWFQRGRGMALGLMVGALTLGSGSPHLLRSVFLDNWQATILGSSILAFAASGLILVFVKDGPFEAPGARLSPRYMLRAFTERLGWPCSATWAICGSFTRCGPG